MDTVTRNAYAKVNLGLDIVGIREDGYHLVKMVMQTVELHDVLSFKKAEGREVVLRISDKSTLPDLADVPTDGRNLIVKAVERMRQRYGITEGVEITLEKHIPMAAGMAGGSTDCAAALRGMTELFGLPCTEEELAETGVALGADVPYCLTGGTALSQGIGEVLTELSPMPGCGMIVVKPGFGASTKEVYGAYDSLDPAGIDHPDIDGMVNALEKGDLSGVLQRLGNVLEDVTAALHPEIHRIEEILIECGAAAAIMTGSGPTVFGIIPEGQDAAAKDEMKRRTEEILREEGIPAAVYVTRVYDPQEVSG